MCQGVQRINIKCGVSLSGKHSLWCQGNSILAFFLLQLFNTAAIIVEEEQGSRGLNHRNESWKWLGPFIYTSEDGFAVNIFFCISDNNSSSFHLRKQINFIFWILFFYTDGVPGCIIPTLTSTETFLECLCKHERDSQSITRETIIQLGTHCVRAAHQHAPGSFTPNVFPGLIPSHHALSCSLSGIIHFSFFWCLDFAHLLGLLPLHCCLLVAWIGLLC